MNYRLKLALGCILAVSAATSAYSADLLEVYKIAVQNDPLIREAEANRMAAREAKPQAWAALLPQLQADASKSRSDTDSTGAIPRALGTDASGIPIFSTGNSSQVTDGHDWSVSLRQTIFRWDQFVALSRADAQVAQAEATYRAAEQDLIVRVMTRYFAVLYAKDLVDTNEAALTAFSRQLEQNEKRYEVGLIAITDVQESRAQRDRASANLIDAKRTLATSHELLRELTGQDFETLAAPGVEMPLNAPTPVGVDAWVSAAMEQNLNLIIARLGSEVAQKNVSIARSGHYPTLSLNGRYLDSNSDFDSESQTNLGVRQFQSSSGQTGSTISLNLSIPIFAGGGTQSVVRQQVQTYRAARERVERTTRETERSVRDNYLGVLSNISRVQALKQAVESSSTSLQATQAGFEVGTRTTVDVLEGQRQLYASQAEYYKSRYDYLQTRVLLEQAAGQLNIEDLNKINDNLKQP
jgi:outer membrane protein